MTDSEAEHLYALTIFLCKSDRISKDKHTLKQSHFMPSSSSSSPDSSPAWDDDHDKLLAAYVNAGEIQFKRESPPPSDATGKAKYLKYIQDFTLEYIKDLEGMADDYKHSVAYKNWVARLKKQYTGRPSHESPKFTEWESSCIKKILKILEVATGQNNLGNLSPTAALERITNVAGSDLHNDVRNAALTTFRHMLVLLDPKDEFRG